MKQIKRLFQIDPWKIRTTHLDKEKFTFTRIINEHWQWLYGDAGEIFEEHYSGDHHQGTYLAGVWYPDKTRVGWWKKMVILNILVK